MSKRLRMIKFITQVAPKQIKINWLDFQLFFVWWGQMATFHYILIWSSTFPKFLLNIAFQIVGLCFYTVSELRDGEQGTRMMALIAFPVGLLLSQF